MKLQEFTSAFLIGAAVIWFVELLLPFQNLWLQIPNIPFIGRAKLVGGLAAVLLIWILREKKVRFIPISI